MLGPGWTVPGYTHVRVLVRGPRGVVTLATDDASGRRVAIDYRSEAALTDAERQRLAELDDPHLLVLYDHVVRPWGTAIVTEYAAGVSLRDILREHGAIAPEPALWVLMGSLRGLAAGHRLGLVHGDLRPEDVLVTPDGQVKLRGFGIGAKAGVAAAGGAATGYLSPQRWQGAPASPDADVYAATAAFVESLTGQPPYPVRSRRQTRWQHERAPIPAQDTPAPVRDLVERGLAKQLADRPPHAAVLLVELEAAAPLGYGEDWAKRGRDQLARRAVLAGLLPAAAPGPSEAVVAVDDQVRRTRAAGVLAAAAALLLVGGVVAAGEFGGLPGGQAEQSAPAEGGQARPPFVPAGEPRPGSSARGDARSGPPAGGPLLGPAAVSLPGRIVEPGAAVGGGAMVLRGMDVGGGTRGTPTARVRESPSPLVQRQARPANRSAGAAGSSTGPQSRSAPPTPPMRGQARERDRQRERHGRAGGSGPNGGEGKQRRAGGAPDRPDARGKTRRLSGGSGGRGGQGDDRDRERAGPRSKRSRDAGARGEQHRGEGDRSARASGGHGGGPKR